MVVDNYNAIYGKRTDQADLKLLFVYYFLLRKGVSFLQIFCYYNLKQNIYTHTHVHTYTKVSRSCWLPECREKAKGRESKKKKKNEGIIIPTMNRYPRNG